MRGLAGFAPAWIAGLLWAGVAHADLPDSVSAALQRAGVPADHVAVYVRPVDAAEPVLVHQPDAALNPASTMKLLTSFAALDTLGPAWMWKTGVWLGGEVKDGTLAGPLIVKGYGDPTLTLERLWLLQREVRRLGVTKLGAGLALDTGYFDLPEADPGAFDGAPLRTYNAPAGALVANYNAIPLRFEPDGAGVRAVPELAPPGFVLDTALTPAKGRCEGWRDALAAVPQGGGTLRLDGDYPVRCGEQTLALNLFPVDVTFDFLFRALWAEGGDAVTRPAAAGEAPGSPPDLAVESAPLAEVLRTQNKFSNNLMTKNLFLSLGAVRFGAPGTPEKGARAVRESLARHGVAQPKLVIENGSGLSRIARVTARMMGEMLVAAAHAPWAPEFEASLPIAGVDGTLKRRFRDSAVAGRAHLKTGTLRDTSALAGYVLTGDGHKLAFVMLVNHPAAAGVGAAQQALLDWAAAWPASGIPGMASAKMTP